MKIGKLYQLTDKAKKEFQTRSNNILFDLGINVYDPTTKSYVSYDINIFIIPLELSDILLDGKKLKGEHSRRVNALLPDGTTGFIYTSLFEWEEVKKEK